MRTLFNTIVKLVIGFFVVFGMVVTFCGLGLLGYTVIYGVTGNNFLNLYIYETPTPIATVTPTPTLTPYPTYTPAPTYTPEPTYTPHPPPTVDPVEAFYWGVFSFCMNTLDDGGGSHLEVCYGAMRGAMELDWFHNPPPGMGPLPPLPKSTPAGDEGVKYNDQRARNCLAGESTRGQSC